MTESPDQLDSRELVRAVLDKYAGPWYVAETPTQREKVMVLAAEDMARDLVTILAQYWEI